MPEDPREEFRRRFGRAAESAARAPGRVNLIGEHTDYNDGLVLPCAIDRDTRVVLARRDDERVRVHSRETGETREFDARAPAHGGDWLDYVQGVVFALGERGVCVGGLDIAVESDVPPEAGLSSSAALGLALVTAIDAVLDLELDAETRARVAHRSESGFVGVACGIMDQFASGLGRRGCALRIDCRSHEVTPIPLPDVRLLIADSGGRRALAHGGYADRVAECAQAFDATRVAGLAPAEATTLRDVEPDSLPALSRTLPDLPFRRLRHVVTENARVDETCAALARGDLEGAGACLRAGQASLRDDYEVSTPELDLLCELADALPGVHGSRLTGAGFGGCTLHLVAPEAVERVASDLAEEFERRTGLRPRVWTAAAAEGASRLPV